MKTIAETIFDLSEMVLNLKAENEQLKFEIKQLEKEAKWYKDLNEHNKNTSIK